jgi:hypothetical protein
MPREDRRIFFDYDETFKAIHSLCVQKGVPRPPAGIIVRIDPNIENPLEMDVLVESQRTHNLETIKYSRDFIVASLMIFCRGVGIPLPKAANKVLELMPDKVILRVQMIR